MDRGSGELSAESYPFKKVTWKIPNFYDLEQECGLCLESPEFPFANGTWCLRISLKFKGGRASDSLYLVRLRSGVPEHRISLRARILHPGGREYCTKELKMHIEGEEASFVMRLSYDTCDLVDLQHTLTVICEIHVTDVAGVETSSQRETLFEAGAASLLGELTGTSAHEAEVQGGPPGVQKQQSDYKTLLQSGEDSDVLLVVSGKEFRAHRCILRARSSVFSAMFKGETQERESGKVVIDDLDPDSFPDFLNHLYTGRVEEFSDENAFSLYTAADKYDVQELKSECREYMQRTLSVDTFCDVMILALRYREKELLTRAIDFFAKNLDKIIVTSKWLKFMRDNYVEANELLVKALVSGGKKLDN